MISNCPLKFVCSQTWSDLRPEDTDPDCRFFTDCKEAGLPVSDGG